MFGSVYSLIEVYVVEGGDIKTRYVKTFSTEYKAKNFMKVCQELKPQTKFIIEVVDTW